MLVVRGLNVREYSELQQICSFNIVHTVTMNSLQPQLSRRRCLLVNEATQYTQAVNNSLATATVALLDLLCVKINLLLLLLLLMLFANDVTT